MPTFPLRAEEIADKLVLCPSNNYGSLAIYLSVITVAGWPRYFEVRTLGRKGEKSVKALILKKHFNLGLLRRLAGWHIRYYFRGRGSPVSFGALITNKCNCKCVMCNIWKNQQTTTLSLKAHLESIDALSTIGCYYHSVAGGEPTLVQDLITRLEYAAKKIPYVHFVTNGLTMTNVLAKQIAKSGIKEVSISIDGNETFHNFVRGRPDAYARAHNAFDLLRTYAPGVTLVINSILTRNNVAEIRVLNRELCRQPNVYQKLLPVSHHELLNNMDVDFDLFKGFRESDLASITSFLKSCMANKTIVNSKPFLKKAIQHFRGTEDLLAEQKKCLYSYHALDITSDGNAYPCFGGRHVGKSYTKAGRCLQPYLRSKEYRDTQKVLESCDKCKGNMLLCYYEPRLNYPLHNLIYYSIHNIFQ